MKHLNTYKLFETSAIKEYPHEKLYRLTSWFMNKYAHVAEKENWNIYVCGYESVLKYWDSSEVFIIAQFNLNPNVDPFSLTFDKEKIAAEKYGWKIDDNGVIYDFDKKLFNKNKHLLTATELGII